MNKIVFCSYKYHNACFIFSERYVCRSTNLCKEKTETGNWKKSKTVPCETKYIQVLVWFLAYYNITIVYKTFEVFVNHNRRFYNCPLKSKIFTSSNKWMTVRWSTAVWKLTPLFDAPVKRVGKEKWRFTTSVCCNLSWCRYTVIVNYLAIVSNCLSFCFIYCVSRWGRVNICPITYLLIVVK